ncbi:MAG: substrate-binding domain-containing protein [Herbinix sp.]|nr:substrate-binding domain-containing protein [Herbinix sp.]
MKKMKKLYVFVLVIVLVMAGGCGGKAKQTTNVETEKAETGQADAEKTDTEKTLTIGLIPQSTLYVFYDYVKKGAEDAAKEAGYSINYQGTTTDTDGTGQRQIVEDMMVTGIDALAISATNADAVNDLLKSLEVPVIAWDCSVDPSACKTTVSVDHYKAAQSAAEYMIEKCPEGGKFAVISTNAGNAVIQDREKGFMDKMKSQEGFECIGPFYTNGELEKAANTMQDLLTENPDLKGVFMVNEGSTEGACQTIKNENREDILAVGYDTSESLIIYVLEGYLDGMISQNPYGLGYNSIKQAVAAIEGQTDFPEKMENDFVLVTSDNIHEAEITKVLDPLGTMNLN